MAHRQTLNENQLSVLKWIRDGCPEGVMKGHAHRISAAALRGRGLVRTSGRGESWKAEITQYGRAYLERAARPDSPAPRQANVSVTEQLVSDVIAADGVLRVPYRYGRGEVDYSHRAALAERYRKVPPGKRLVTQPVDGELEIRLEEAPAGTDVPLGPISVPERVGRYHPVVRSFRDRNDLHEVSKAALPRTLRILHALVTEAERRGHGVTNVLAHIDAGQRSWSGRNDGHLVISVGDHESALRLREDGLPSRVHWARELSRSWRRDELRGRHYDDNATGRLCIELVSGYSCRGRPAKWADRKAWRLEEKLPEVLREIEVRAAEAEHERREMQRAAEERERRWEAAMVLAKQRYLEAHRGKELREQVTQWRQAVDIRAYCDTIETLEGGGEETRDWVAWARKYAASIDPLRRSELRPADPEKVQLEDLTPFLDGWSPYGPERHRY